MPCLANKFDSCTRLHIGSKIRTLCLLDYGYSLRRRDDQVIEATASQMKYNRSPTPSVAEPRRHLLLAVRSFVRSARDCPGVLRIVLLGSLTTTKLTVNLGADIFLANEDGCYVGRICHYRKCFPRVACLAQNCGRCEHLNDDLQVVSLSKELIAARPVTLWPNVVRRVIVPPDVEALLLTDLERAE